jgi:hypothetical protein
MKRHSELALKLYGYIFGIVVGLFLGLFVVGTAIRIILDILFHYGDSGPFWVNIVIVLGTLLSVVVCTRISMSWVRIRIARDKASGDSTPSDDLAGIEDE